MPVRNPPNRFRVRRCWTIHPDVDVAIQAVAQVEGRPVSQLVSDVLSQWVRHTGAFTACQDQRVKQDA